MNRQEATKYLNSLEGDKLYPGEAGEIIDGLIQTIGEVAVADATDFPLEKKLMLLERLLTTFGTYHLSHGFLLGVEYGESL